eukprot:NODE_1736_length_1831_cov_65.029859_g1473_i0.p1 GENE.NODE_1736_length_1831_cov_65.029859_g1473_i0~~NODE_1736_length_1831_cov_65.029859_g1473_i0.p1  ORF type:complete len:488 (+),score=93.46 NODE_1736_length_1831_cov_65.029859_g1473_i0:103-1464(+)
MFIPTDCPQRERRGWLADAYLASATCIYNFDMAGFYVNFLQQIADAQNKTSGAVAECAPFYGHGTEPADPAWGSAYTFFADIIATYYEDDRIFGTHYEGIKAHLDFLIKEAASGNMDGLLTYSLHGDWCPPQGCQYSDNHTNSALVSSYSYLQQLRLVARYANLLSRTQDSVKYARYAEQVSNAFNTHFYDPVAKTYREANRSRPTQFLGPQTCISLADNLGLIPSKDRDEVMNNLIHDVVVTNNMHLDVGIIGVKELLPELTKIGRVDIALSVVNTPTPPSWVYMLDQGATTLWETWTGSRYAPNASWNHIMYGSQGAWYYQTLAGINMAPQSRAWKQIVLFPKVYASASQVSICSELSYVRASVNTLRGVITSSWTCSPVIQSLNNGDMMISCPSGNIRRLQLVSTKDSIYSKCSTLHKEDFIQFYEKKCLGQSKCSVPNYKPCVGDISSS